MKEAKNRARWLQVALSGLALWIAFDTGLLQNEWGRFPGYGSEALAQNNAVPQILGPFINHSAGNLPLRFEVNQGQTDRQVKFLSRGSGYALFLTSTDMVLSLRKPRPKAFDEKHQALTNRGITAKGVDSNPLLIRFAGSNTETKVVGLEEQRGKSNYFHGNDQKRWRSNVGTYAKVKYEGIYPGIDLIFYGNDHQLEYDFIVSPGTDPNAIGLHIEGAEKLEINDLGDLIIHTSVGELCLRKPFAYQEIERVKHVITSRYVIGDTRKVGFQLGTYDSSKLLVIDPVLSYSTYLGGKGDDYAEGIAVDPSGNIYVTGLTPSADFLSQNPLQTGNGSGVFKSLDGGSTWNAVNEALTNNNILAIAIDPVTPSRLYVGTKDGLFKSIDAGTTWNPANTGLPTSEIIAVAIDPVTPTSVYVSSSGGGLFKSMNAGDSWSPINTGLTSSKVLVLAIDPVTPTTIYAGTGWGLFKTTNSGENWSELNLPESFDKHIRSIAIDPSNPTTLYAGAEMGGLHKSVDGGATWESAPIVIQAGQPVSALAIDSAVPMTLYAGVGGGVYKSIDGAENWNAVLAAGAGVNALAIDPKTATTLYAGTYGKGVFKSTDGGENWNAVNTGLTNKRVYAIAIDPVDPTNLYTGTDSGGLFDVFVVKLNPTDFSPIYSTYIGGSNDDYGRGIAVDTDGNAYVCGYTTSEDFPVTQGAFQASMGGSGDAFIFKLNPEGSSLVYSTYLGGSGSDEAFGIASDSAGNAYITGGTGSNNFPVTEGAFKTTNNWGGDAFVSKLNATGSALAYSTYLGGGGGDEGYGIAVDGSGMACVTGATTSWDFPTTPGAYQPNKSNDPSSDAYLTKLNPTGSALVYSTYLGGNGTAYHLVGSAVAFDSGGDAYVVGSGLNYGTYDVFMHKLTANGSIQPYGFFRIDGDQFAHGIAVDASGNILITGRTHSPKGDFDAFIAKLDIKTGLSIFLLGGNLFDEGSAIAVDPSGNVYLTGNTASRDFPTTTGALQSSFGGGLYDTFIVKVGFPAAPTGCTPESPANGEIFDSCSLINTYPPSFNWTAHETFTKFSILFSISPTDFTSRGILIVRGAIKGTMNKWNALIALWKNIMTSSYNKGSVRDIYWKVIGTKPDRTAIESEIWSFRVGNPQNVIINAPAEGSILPSAKPPLFNFNSNCSIKFLLQFSSLNDFSDPKKIRGFTFTTKHPNAETVVKRTLAPWQWTAVKRLIGSGTGYFRIKAWDGIKRETISEVRSFTVQ